MKSRTASTRGRSNRAKVEHFHLRNDYPRPCVECGEATENPRDNVEVVDLHYRVLFAILYRLRAGETAKSVAHDYDLRHQFVRTLQRFAGKKSK